MTVREFLEEIQAYYEQKYSEIVCAYITKWLKGKSPEFLDVLFDEVILKHSRVYKCLPDVAILERCKAEAIEALELKRQKLAPPTPRIEPSVESEELRKEGLAMLEGLLDVMRGKIRAVREGQ